MELNPIQTTGICCMLQDGSISKNTGYPCILASFLRTIFRWVVGWSTKIINDIWGLMLNSHESLDLEGIYIYVLGRFCRDRISNVQAKSPTCAAFIMSEYIILKKNGIPSMDKRHKFEYSFYGGMTYANNSIQYTYGCFLKWWYSQKNPKWSFLVGKPMVVGYHHLRKPPYVLCMLSYVFQFHIANHSTTINWGSSSSSWTNLHTLLDARWPIGPSETVMIHEFAIAILKWVCPRPQILARLQRQRHTLGRQRSHHYTLEIWQWYLLASWLQAFHTKYQQTSPFIQFNEVNYPTNHQQTIHLPIDTASGAMTIGRFACDMATAP